MGLSDSLVTAILQVANLNKKATQQNAEYLKAHFIFPKVRKNMNLDWPKQTL